MADTVQLDEIFDALDPQTRASFKTWQQELSKGIEGRGRDFNDALGTLPGFAADGSDVLHVLATQDAALQRLVKNTGVTFAALTENEQQLQTLITSSKRVFDATASRNNALAEAIRIFPTFLDESKATLARLDEFSRDTDPLVQDLRPVAQDLKPTLADVRATAPDLERFFRNLDPLIDASKTGLPAARDTIEGAEPLLDARSARSSSSSTRCCSTSSCRSRRCRTSSPRAGRPSRTRPRRRAAASVTTCASSGRWAPRAWRSTASGWPPTAARRTSGRSTCSARRRTSTSCSRRPTARTRAASTRRPQGNPGCWKADQIRFQGRLQGDFPHIAAADYARRPAET